jgi:hypothetical protein
MAIMFSGRVGRERGQAGSVKEKPHKIIGQAGRACLYSGHFPVIVDDFRGFASGRGGRSAEENLSWHIRR